MSIDVVVKKQKLNFDKENPRELFVAAADRNSIVDLDKLAYQVSLESGANKHQVKAMMSVMIDAMTHFLEGGHGVKINGFGSFLPAVKSVSSTNADDVGVKKVYVTFRPSKSLSEKVSAIHYATVNPYVTSTTVDSGTSDSGTNEDDENLYG